jgi:hypothetical protein
MTASELKKLVTQVRRTDVAAGANMHEARRS